MNTKEIKKIGWDYKKRIDLPSLPEFKEFSMKRLHGIRCLMSRNRAKTNNLCAVRLGFRNLIVCRFPLASFGGKELIKVSMELQHDTCGERDVGMFIQVFTGIFRTARVKGLLTFMVSI